MKADLFASAPAGIKPEWYFLFMFQSLKYIPAEVLYIEGEIVGILLFGLAFALWTMVPFLDRKSNLGQENKVVTYAGLFVVAFVIALTIFGWIA